MRKVRSCGVLVMRQSPGGKREFLVMRHARRLDLPKGHLEEGEAERSCALRELFEETGIAQDAIELDPRFQFTQTYYPKYKRFGGETVEKTIVVFLGELKEDVSITPHEHGDFEWMLWDPPHALPNAPTLQSVLAQVEAQLANGS